MADRKAVRLAVTVSCVGLMADIAYIQISAAMLFLTTEEWAAGLAYGVGALVTVAVITTLGWDRIKSVITATEAHAAQNALCVECAQPAPCRTRQALDDTAGTENG